MIGGAILSPYTTWSFWVYIAGGIVALDDIYQHHRQVEDPGYHSPVHRAYGVIYHKFEWIRNLNESVSDLIHNLRKK